MTEKQKNYNWIMNIIDSCNNTFHFDGADALIELFHQRHADAALTDLLKEQRYTHFNNVHNILS